VLELYFFYGEYINKFRNTVTVFSLENSCVLLALPPSRLQSLLPLHGLDLDGPRGGSRAPVGDLSGADPLLPCAVLCAPEPAVHAPSPRRQEEPERAAGRRPPRRRVHVCYFSLCFECPIAMSVKHLLSSRLTCCFVLIVSLSSFVLLQVLCSNHSFPQVKRSQYSHSVHVSRLDGKQLTLYVYFFCCPIHLFI